MDLFTVKSLLHSLNASLVMEDPSKVDILVKLPIKIVQMEENRDSLEESK